MLKLKLTEKKSNLYLNGLKAKKVLVDLNQIINLKSKKGFSGFDPNHKLTPILNEMLSKADPDFAKKPDIKWNFTKFLIDRKGHVVERFEPTADKTVLIPAIEAEIKK